MNQFQTLWGEKEVCIYYLPSTPLALYQFSNSNNFHTLRRIPQMSTSSCSSSSVLKSNTAWKRHLLQFYAMYLAYLPIMISLKTWSAEDFLFTTTLSLRLYELIQSYVIFPLWPKGHENVFPFHSKKTLYLWYVVEK